MVGGIHSRDKISYCPAKLYAISTYITVEIVMCRPTRKHYHNTICTSILVARKVLTKNVTYINVKQYSKKQLGNRMTNFNRMELNADKNHLHIWNAR